MIPEILIFGSIILLAFLYWKYKKDIALELMIAGLISVVWVVISGFYIYKTSNYIFFGINIFAFVLWTTGLVLFKEYSEFLDKFKVNNYEELTIALYWIIISATWIAGIITIEYIGYNWLGIQLISNYPGIFGIEAIHLPLWGKLYYLVAGILFVAIGKIWKVK